MLNSLQKISEIKDSYNLLTTKKWLKSDLGNLQPRWKKLKKYWKVGNQVSINANIKSTQI